MKLFFWHKYSKASRPAFVLAAIITAFLLISTFKLDLRVVMDEPWLSVPGHTLITQGKLAIPPFQGSAEGYDRIMLVPPLQLLLLAGVFKLFGLGLIQGRLLSVFFGALTILGTYLLAKQLYDTRIALAAAVLLAADNYFFLASRSIRGEIFVAFFLLLSVYALLNAQRKNRPGFYLASGVALGLGVLSHQNAVLGLVALMLMFYLAEGFSMLIKRGLYIFFVGLILTMLPYFIFLLLAGHYFGYAYIWKQLEMDGRVLPIFSLAWLLVSLKGEIYQRYTDFIYFPSRLHIALLYGGALIYGFYKKNKAEMILLSVVCSYIVLFYVLVVNKNVRYLVNFLPFVCILTAGMIFELCKSAFGKWLGKILPLAIVAVMVISELAVTAVFFRKYSDSGYNKFMEQVAASVPARASVYAPITFWFGLRDHAFYAYNRVPFKDALNKYKVRTYIFEDKIPWAYQNETATIQAYMKKYGILLNRIHNSFYGDINIYKISDRQ